MKIAIISDSHDHLEHLRKALEICKREKVAQILHCGDFVAPFVLRELNGAGIPVDGVFGNNDGDIYTMTRLSLTELKNITLHNLLAELEFEGRKIAITHTPEVGIPLLQTEAFDLVCWGHTHFFDERRFNTSLGINPGDIMGKEHAPGFCIYDTLTQKYEHVILD